MSTNPTLKNLVRERRVARGWSQQELADRAAIARASVSAIEMGRLVPSAAAALALAAALDCRVEDLFQLAMSPTVAPAWAWEPTRIPARYWQAEVSGHQWLYPLEPTYLGTLAHDGLFDGTALLPRVESPPSTLVLACCDPAVGLLATEFSRESGVRLLPLMRSSRAALRLLKDGFVHAAGLHLGPAGSEANAAAIREELGAGFRLVRVADWEEGVVTPTDRKLSSLEAILRSRLRWVGREAGSGARQCLDEVLGSKPAPRHIARDHRGVAEAVRAGWADAGVCLRLVGEEASLQFLPIRSEAYDVCYPAALENDSRVRALLAALRSPRYRVQLDDLPGYRATSGDVGDA
jgi:molybdate-binding protein/transcriptional regulator with XRE-family HTH domain